MSNKERAEHYAECDTIFGPIGLDHYVVAHSQKYYVLLFEMLPAVFDTAYANFFSFVNYILRFPIENTCLVLLLVTMRVKLSIVKLCAIDWFFHLS